MRPIRGMVLAFALLVASTPRAEDVERRCFDDVAGIEKAARTWFFGGAQVHRLGREDRAVSIVIGMPTSGVPTAQVVLYESGRGGPYCWMLTRDTVWGGVRVRDAGEAIVLEHQDGGAPVPLLVLPWSALGGDGHTRSVTGEQRCFDGFAFLEQAARGWFFGGADLHRFASKGREVVVVDGMPTSGVPASQFMVFERLEDGRFCWVLTRNTTRGPSAARQEADDIVLESGDRLLVVPGTGIGVQGHPGGLKPRAHDRSSRFQRDQKGGAAKR